MKRCGLARPPKSAGSVTKDLVVVTISLKELESYINEDILILSGDLIFNIDFKKFFLFHKKNKSDITFLVHPNDHPFDSDLLEVNKKNRLIKDTSNVFL